MAICCGSYTFRLKLALWVSCLRSTALGCRAPGLATPGRAELDGPAPSPLLILLAPLVKSAPSAVGSASCLLHLPLCALCQPLALSLMLCGSSGLLLGSLPTLPAILQPHHSTLWRRTPPPAALAHFCCCCTPVCTFPLCSR